MTCDATSTDELIAGDDWVWDYSTTDDISGWSDPVIQIRDGLTPSSTLLASNVIVDSEALVTTDGGLEGSVPATDFPAGNFAWWVAAADSAPLATSGSVVVYLEVSVLVSGARQTVWPATAYTVRPQVAVEVTGS